MSEIVSYETGGNCTSRNYSVTRKKHLYQLQLYSNNRSGDSTNLIVNITFESCPIAFERSNVTGDCICDHRLQQYTDSCNIDKQAILRNANRTLNFWLQGVSYVTMEHQKDLFITVTVRLTTVPGRASTST